MSERKNKGEDKSKSWKIFTRFASYLGVYKKRMVFMYLMNILQVTSALMIPLLIKHTVDEHIVPKDLTGLKQTLILIAGVLVIQFFSARIQAKQITHIGYGVLYTLRQQLFSHIQSLGLRFFDSRKKGNIMTRITSDVEVLEELVANGLVSVVVDSLMLIGITTMMLILDLRLSLVLFVTLPLFFFLVFYVRNKIRKTATDMQQSLGRVNSFLNESMSGIKVIRSFAREKVNGDNFQRINDEYYGRARKFYPLISYFWQGVATISALGIALVLLGGGLLLSKDLISLGVIAAFLSYINRFYQPMQKLSNLLNQISRSMVSCERIFEILDEEPEIIDGPHALSVSHLKGDVSFENLSFSYNPEEPVLEEVSFDAPAGQTVAIVGPTGAGKSTIVNLLCRFYEADKGCIKVDGRDIRDYKIRDYRNQTSIVMQDSVIFTGSLMDNLRYGQPDSTEEEILTVTKELGIHEMFSNLDQGYQTKMSEGGANLSLGQKQLVSFVRALIRNPQILILDEASAYIDSQTELLVQKTMTRLRQNRTCFIIAHRLSTIRDAHKIVVIDNHKVIETGTHDELIRLGGHYANYVHSQFSHS